MGDGRRGGEGVSHLSFLPKMRSGSSIGPDFDPFAQRPKNPPAPSKTSQQESNKSSSFLSNETFDDSQMDSVFNEQTCRRNMKISRSGRFKEKKKIRSTLPEEAKERVNVASGREDRR
uniref:Uncharacterized protein n=1 Tax=Amphilophus citrinellus TaxID=61819 RepID=A0A3Q0QWN6_AMPCI